MSFTLYLIIFMVGSVTLSKKANALATSVKTKHTERIKADVFFLSLTVLLIVLLVCFVWTLE